MPIDLHQFEGKKVRAKIKTASADTTVIGWVKITHGGAFVGAIRVGSTRDVLSVEIVETKPVNLS